MTNAQNVFKLLLLFVMLVVLQVFVFNNLDFLGVVNAYPYILLLLTMPFGMSTKLLMFVALFLGLSVDVLCNTPGMHASACVLLAFMRRQVLRWIAIRNEYKAGDLPTLQSYDIEWYAKYMLVLVTAHHFLLFMVEQIDSFLFWPTLLRMVSSILATSLVIWILQVLVPINGKS